jgi:ABC-type phosphate/phosphonate transport system permease subunit
VNSHSPLKTGLQTAWQKYLTNGSYASIINKIAVLMFSKNINTALFYLSTKRLFFFAKKGDEAVSKVFFVVTFSLSKCEFILELGLRQAASDKVLWLS